MKRLDEKCDLILGIGQNRSSCSYFALSPMGVPILLAFCFLLVLAAGSAGFSYADSSLMDGSGEAREFVRSVNHGGYSMYAPENTMPAYELSAEVGFDYVETDVCFTKDNVPVLLHDDTINSTGRNFDGSEIAETIHIGDLTYKEARTHYDFGIWKGPEFRRTKLPRLEDFLVFCRDMNLHPYLELKRNGDYTQDQINMVVDMVSEKGMRGKVTWISFEMDFLHWIAERDPEARLGYISFFSNDEGFVRDLTDKVNSLRTGSNYVFVDLGIANQSGYSFSLYKDAGVPVEVWIMPQDVDAERQCLENLDPYISGVTAAQLQYGSPEVELAGTRLVFDGTAKRPGFTVRNGGKILTEGTDYVVSYPEDCIDAGEYSFSVKLTEKFAGPVMEATQTFTVDKADNPLKIKGKTAKIKYAKIKKKTQKLRAAKAFQIVREGQGTISYKLDRVTKSKFRKYFSIDSGTGDITIKKGLKKGTYRLTINAEASGDSNYKASGDKTAAVKIKVK